MSGGSFVFTSTALRSLELDGDMLARQKHRKKQLTSHHFNRYMLKKEIRDRAPPKPSDSPPALCRDAVVQNALYTGDLEAVRRLFPRGATANLIIEPLGGDMRWVPAGDGERQRFVMVIQERSDEFGHNFL